MVGGSTIFVFSLEYLLNAYYKPGSMLDYITTNFRYYLVQDCSTLVPSYAHFICLEAVAFQFPVLAFDCFLSSSWKESWRSSHVQLSQSPAQKPPATWGCPQFALPEVTSPFSKLYTPLITFATFYSELRVFSSSYSYFINILFLIKSLYTPWGQGLCVLLTVMPFKFNIKLSIQWKCPSETNTVEPPVVCTHGR